MSTRDRLGLRGKTAGEGFAFHAWYLGKHRAHILDCGTFFARITPIGPMIAWQEGRR